MRRITLMVAAASVALSACAGPTLLVAGEALRSPEPPPPIIPFAVLAADDLTPVTAQLQVEDQSAVTDVLGMASLVWREEWADRPASVSVGALGFKTAVVQMSALPEEGPIEVHLEPIVVTGTVTGPDGRPLPATKVTLGDLVVVTDSDGEFRIVRAVGTDLDVSRPAWLGTSIPWRGQSDIAIELEPRMIRALRVGGYKAGNPGTWEELLGLADHSAINAFVIDTKDERGTVFYSSGVATAHEIGAVESVYNLSDVLDDMEAHGLYKITRIVTFQDPPLATAMPELAIRDSKTGRPWETYSGREWLDPTDRESWVYPLALAEEACRRGFDEIQFDYVRFPSDGPISQARFDNFAPDEYYSAEAQQQRVETIAAFLEAAYELLNPLGCAVAATIFAITLESRSDEGIGQLPGPLSHHVDVLSPMIYSYAYGSGWKGFTDPNEHAPEIVALALDAGIPRLQGFSIYRPWLQRAFLSSADVLSVQEVAEERDLGWMLWSENTLFDATMLPPG